MNTCKIKINISIRKGCLWLVAILSLLHIPAPKWMFIINKAES